MAEVENIKDVEEENEPVAGDRELEPAIAETTQDSEPMQGEDITFRVGHFSSGSLFKDRSFF